MTSPGPIQTQVHPAPRGFWVHSKVWRLLNRPDSRRFRLCKSNGAHHTESPWSLQHEDINVFEDMEIQNFSLT